MDDILIMGLMIILCQCWMEKKNKKYHTIATVIYGDSFFIQQNTAEPTHYTKSHPQISYD